MDEWFCVGGCDKERECLLSPPPPLGMFELFMLAPLFSLLLPPKSERIVRLGVKGRFPEDDGLMLLLILLLLLLPALFGMLTPPPPPWSSLLKLSRCNDSVDARTDEA